MESLLSIARRHISTRKMWACISAVESLLERDALALVLDVEESAPELTAQEVRRSLLHVDVVRDQHRVANICGVPGSQIN